MTPDARLSAAERAALADLEAAASAADPHLAARLKGSPMSRLPLLVPACRSRLMRVWAALLEAAWWGIPLSVGGLVLMVLGMSAGLGLSVLGALATAVGLRMVAELVDRHLRRRADEAGHRAGTAE